MKSPFVSRKKYEELEDELLDVCESLRLLKRSLHAEVGQTIKLKAELAKYKRPRDKQGRFVKG